MNLRSIILIDIDRVGWLPRVNRGINPASFLTGCAGDAVAKKEIKAEEVVRLAGTDLDGNRYVYMALLGIKGIGYNLARALVRVLGIDEKKKLKELDEKELSKLEDAVKHPWKYGIPAWMLNRRKDRETGKDIHLIGTDLTMQVKDDLERLKRIRSYRGIKHELGLPVRGQRTRSTFRKGQTVGVSRKKK